MWSWLDTSWKQMLSRGLIALVFGAVAVLYPLSTAMALALVWGIWALADGVTSLGQAVRPAPPTARLLLAAIGVIGLAAGLLAVTSPGLTAVALTWILGIWLVARGVLDATLAIFGAGAASRAGLLFSGAVDLVLGALFVLNPGRAALQLAVVLGVTALVWGAGLVLAAVLTRRRLRDDSSVGTARASTTADGEPADDGSEATARRSQPQP